MKCTFLRTPSAPKKMGYECEMRCTFFLILQSGVPQLAHCYTSMCNFRFALIVMIMGGTAQDKPDWSLLVHMCLILEVYRNIIGLRSSHKTLLADGASFSNQGT